jgi:alginate O-acetyltransferase complex protein AlgI
VSFFPQLVAGPIERATRLLPQLLTRRQFDYEQARLGLGLIVWGLFKKVVIADSFAPLVDGIFENASTADALTLLTGAVLFAFQIYGDFSGYSDIAIGVAALFGMQLMTNFNKPYFAATIQEFWRRWHISLTTWFKDYLYIPLGGSRVSQWKVFRNVFLVFAISGLWHGANFTFLAWGTLHFVFYIPHLLRMGSIREQSKRGLPKMVHVIVTFLLVSLAWVFFRADSVMAAWEYVTRIATWQSGTGFIQSNTHWVLLAKGGFGVALLLLYESITFTSHRVYNGFHFFFLVMALLLLGSFRNPVSFIYFQF